VYGWFLFVATFISICGAGLWVLFLVYVFTSLTEMRALLREIAANTRAPHAPPTEASEQGSHPASPSPPKPFIPAPVDFKYMPKS
jgi:hypothetical protein